MNKCLRAIAIATLAAIVALASACGGHDNGGNFGGGGSTTPTQPTTNFDNSYLTGDYVFSLKGFDSRSYPLAIIGSLHADGHGGVTSWSLRAHDYQDSNTQLLNGVSGSYAISADGRGQMLLGSGASATSFNFVLTSMDRVHLLEMNNQEISYGLMEYRTPQASAMLSGAYVFRLTGSYNSVAAATVGVFNVDANGALSGVADENFGAENQTYAKLPISGQAITSVNGVGSLTMSAGGLSQNFDYIPVSATRVLLLESDAEPMMIGAAEAKNAAAINVIQPSGRYVAQLSGSDLQYGPTNELGYMNFDASGYLTVNEDMVDAAYFTPRLSFGGATASDLYGRVTAAPSGGHNYVFYMSDDANGVALTLDSDFVESGWLKRQTAQPSPSGRDNNFALSMNGLTKISTDSWGDSTAAVGQVKLQAGQASGTEDYNQGGALKNNVALAGSLAFDANGRGAGKIGATPVVFYAVDDSTLFFLNQTANGQQDNVNNQLSGALEAQLP